MPKYSLDEVLDIIRGLTSAEKEKLVSLMPSVLDVGEKMPQPTSRQNQSISVGGDFAVSGQDLVVDFSQKQASGLMRSGAKLDNLASGQVIQALVNELAVLKREISDSPELSQLQKETAEAPIAVLEEELKKSAPDKGLIDQAIASMRKGLNGVQTLAEPTMKVAALVAKAWTGL